MLVCEEDRDVRDDRAVYCVWVLLLLVSEFLIDAVDGLLDGFGDYFCSDQGVGWAPSGLLCSNVSVSTQRPGTTAVDFGIKVLFSASIW